MEDKKILFVTYGGGHSEIVRRILHFCPPSSYRILALTSAYEKFSGVEVYGILDVYNSLSQDLKIKVDEIIAYIRLNQLNLGVSWNEYSLVYYALGALDYVCSQGHLDLSDFHWNRHRFLQLISIKSFILNLRDVGLIVTTTSPRFERAALVVGNELNIPTIQIDDLFANPEALFIGKYIVVCSDMEVDRLAKRGIERNRIYSLGNPVFEEFYKMNVDISGNRRIYFCPHKDKLYDNRGIEIFHGNDRANHLKEFEGLALLLQNNEGYELVVRPHPNDSKDEYLEYLSICDFTIIHPCEESLECSLNQAALWITPASTTGVQASQAGVPSISYSFRNSDVHPVWRMTQPPFLFFKDLDDLVLGLSSLVIEEQLAVSDCGGDWSFLDKSGNRISKFILSKV